MSDGAPSTINMQRPGRYALLATAVAGRSITTAGSTTQSVYTDGQVIYLPERAEEHVQAGVVVQAAILRCGGLDRKSVLKLMGRESVASRYLVLEAIRAAAQVGNVMPAWLHQHILALSCGPISSTAEESLERAMRQKSLPEAPEWLGTIRPLALLRAQVLTAAGSRPSESERRTAEQKLSEDDDEDGDDESSERSAILTKLSGPLPENPISKFFKKHFAAKRSPNEKGDQGGGAEMTANSVRWMKRVGAGASLITTALRPTQSEPVAVVGTTYPEWEHLSGTYLLNWCRVTHYEVAGTQPLGQGSVPDRMLRRRLARLGTSYEQHHGQSDGEDLDDNALINFIVDQATGNSPEERVYTSTRKTGRDLAALVLLDASGSTADQQAGQTSIWDVQRALAQDLVAAFDDLGDMVCAYAFRSFGRNDVRFLRIKEVGERFSQAARARLRSVAPSGYTRLGAAIRHAAHLLATKAHSGNQLLVVVSDGLPYDIGYEDTHAEQDVRQALREAEQLGVGCVCISVGSPRKKEALERVWGNVGHASLESPRDLHRYAEPLFRAAIRRGNKGLGRKVLTRHRRVSG